MDSLALAPFELLRRNSKVIIPAAIPILFIMFVYSGMQMVTENDVNSYPSTKMVSGSLADDVILPLIGFGEIAQKTSIGDIQVNFEKFVVPTIALVLIFICYAMVSRTVHESKKKTSGIGLRGVNSSTMVLSVIASLLVIWVVNLSLNGFEILLAIGVGSLLSFSIPYAAADDGVVRSIANALSFMGSNKRTIGVIYTLGFGFMIALPVFLGAVAKPVVFAAPEIGNTVFVLIVVASMIFLLFYQQVLCAYSVYEWRGPRRRRFGSSYLSALSDAELYKDVKHSYTSEETYDIFEPRPTTTFSEENTDDSDEFSAFRSLFG